MNIRPARLQDAVTIAEFNTRLAWETEQLRLDPETIRRGVRAVLRDARRGRYFVATERGVVIGQLLITHEWSDWRNGDLWWIQSVYVAAAYRQKGVFRALFHHVQARAAAQGNVRGLRLYVERHNRRAQRTYLQLHMKPTAYQVFEQSLPVT